MKTEVIIGDTKKNVDEFTYEEIKSKPGIYIPKNTIGANYYLVVIWGHMGNVVLYCDGECLEKANESNWKDCKFLKSDKQLTIVLTNE